jgi:ATP-dependent DNA helicase Q1
MADEKETLISEMKEIDKSLSSLQENIQTLLDEREMLQDRKRLLQARINSIEDLQQISVQNDLTDWETGRFPWSDEIQSTLGSTFGLGSFRPLQLSCINAVMSRKDVILIMPTGGGKSLCYQLPAVMNHGVTLVISPLVSLMEDQLMSVRKYGIESQMLNASSSKQHVNNVYGDLIDKNNTSLKILYVTPEKVSKSKVLMSNLEKAYENNRLSCIVIDEVHCTSQWGHDFRPDYKVLGILKRQFPWTPVMGLTATATDVVLEDCKKILNLKTCLVFKASYNRMNLFYEVREKPTAHKDQMSDMAEIVKRKFTKQSGIVYCLSQKDVEQVCVDLCDRNISASCYHANMPPADKTKVHTLWLANKIQVIVATIAFGMGIDKKDVRFVIHHTLSKSMENYYQESGRAGRDGLPAVCVLYYKLGDMFRQSGLTYKEHAGLRNLYSMMKYCINDTRCRRYLIASHFGEVWKQTDCDKMCSICQRGSTIVTEDVTSICQGFLQVLHSHPQNKKLTALKLIEAWKNSPIAKGEFAKAKPTVLKLEKVLGFCLLENILKEDLHFTPYGTVTYILPGAKSHSVRDNRTPVTMEMPVEGKGRFICRYPICTQTDTTSVRTSTGGSSSGGGSSSSSSTGGGTSYSTSGGSYIVSHGDLHRISIQGI